MTVEIRAARASDATAISAVIIATLRSSNARDYSAAVIERVAHHFTPNALVELIGKRTVFVAEQDDQVVGTASLDAGVIRTVFVRSDLHGQGIGRMLMATLEQVARDRHIEVLQVPSSLTAEPFYRTLGFTTVREVLNGEERTIVMLRRLA